MNVTWQDGSSEINFLLGLRGYTVRITPNVGESFDAVVDDAGHDEQGVVVIRFFLWDEEAGEADRSGDPKVIDADDVDGLEIY